MMMASGLSTGRRLWIVVVALGGGAPGSETMDFMAMTGSDKRPRLAVHR